ncbi:type VI secretion system baseplate subunit TssG [Paraburkholderia sp. LEh10]|uniref:type VI secretion system baseplate subunit TssG n=1 Tax=Paraburkholderia sp. LEh10 TaxID=2821353 RepID=UPI001AE7DA0D|nr:type VI secretion system baseplate subunit TssG [Paraburkholderia sp. LEh10]MBP0593851.1 type VI secretion system baseplate subunit TssG [Paraburkholderia sp. LEh10]
MNRLPSPSLRATLPHDTLEHLQREPWRFGWLALMRRIGADPAIDPVGMAQRPGAEPFRLGQRPNLSFAPSEIADAVQRDDGRLFLRLFSLGMLGPNGPLPIHITEIAREREVNRRDSTLVDFLDIFHHRFLTQLYLAWASTQATAGLDRPGPETETFSFYVGSLAGKDPALLESVAVPFHAQLAASAHMVRENHDTDGIRQTLAQFFQVPVAIDPFVFHWMELPSDEISRLSVPGEASTLGGAVLGEVIPDRQHRFRIAIGPLDLAQYLRFTPDGEDLPLLVDLVRGFVGKSRHWQLELKLKTSSATPATAGGEQQLGWSTWLGENPAAEESIKGMCFEPERDVDRFDRKA